MRNCAPIFIFMRKILFTKIVTISFVFTSCQLQPQNKEFEAEYFLTQDSISIPKTITHKKTINKLCSLNNKEIIASLNKTNETLSYYDSKSFKLITENKGFPNTRGIEDFFIKSVDSIYSIYDGNIISLMDSSMKILRLFKLSPSSNEFNNNYTLSASNHYDPLVIKGDTAFVTHYPTFPLNSREKVSRFFMKKIGISILLKDSSTILSYNKGFPKNYIENTFYSFRPYRLIRENLEIYSYEMNDSLFVKNSQGKAFSIEMKSNHFTKSSSFNFNNISMNNILQYAIQNSAYGKLYYDNNKQLYYRVCMHELNYENKDGSNNLYQDKNWSILVADEKFKVLKEVLFSAKHSPDDILITSNGVLIKRNDETEAIFDLFEF